MAISPVRAMYGVRSGSSSICASRARSNSLIGRSRLRVRPRQHVRREGNLRIVDLQQALRPIPQIERAQCGAELIRHVAGLGLRLGVGRA